MKVSRTNELETVWSHYKCVDPNCPGKHRKHGPPYTDKSGWAELENGRKRHSFQPEPGADNR